MATLSRQNDPTFQFDIRSMVFAAAAEKAAEMNREEYAKVFEEDTNSEIISRTLTICNIYSHEVNRSTSPSFRQWPSTIRVLSRCLNAAVTPHIYDTFDLTSGSWFSILLEEPDHLKYQIRECYTLRIANTKANSEFRQTYKPTVQR
ncbi:hypothetical protein IFR04_005344 [Cadophora malorum]|uniref:Uncharacterized protein n=1 Tax=Cadophora malorum TaxID=108018 RepID=A0A8H7TLM9_9HELO|nr:hypothetical protein IFR04_005344 [Cadophora malorum]